MGQLEYQKIQEILIALLEQEIPNELKAHRIYMDILKPTVDKIKTDYEWAALASERSAH